MERTCRVAGIHEGVGVYEPTAGNGMLLIAATPEDTVANELNSDRASMLKMLMPEANIQQNNAASWTPNPKFDVVIANPPFGVTKDAQGNTISFEVDGVKTNEIDHAIAFNALSRMDDDGTAVLIVGGVTAKEEDARKDAYRSKSKLNFYSNLYGKYNVVGHYAIDGDLYRKQGASYPVDMIVIKGVLKEGESSSRKLPAAALPLQVNSYEQLKNIVKENKDEFSRMGTEAKPSDEGTVGGEASTRETVKQTGLGGSRSEEHTSELQSH